MSGPDFHGAKAAVFIGEQLLVYLRDDRPDIPWPNHWDFPGGGREGAETPEQTLFREIEEEFGLSPGPEVISWNRMFPALHHADARVWFFVLHLPSGAVQDIRFGDEGQEWRLMAWETFAVLPNAVPSFAPRMAVWARETGRVLNAAPTENVRKG